MVKWDVVVVGGGPSGLMAAARAAERGRRTLLLEKNRRPGVKIRMSGGTRCNLTHNTDVRGVVEAFGTSGRFLHSALSRLGPREVVELFEAEGVKTKVEPGGKVFPASDRADDVLAALVARLRRSGATLVTEQPVVELRRAASGFELSTSGGSVQADKLILATGGQSYPGCGTTGDGYRWAEAMGLAIVPPRVGLVPITTEAAWVKELSGVTISDAFVRLIDPTATDAPRGSRVWRKAALTERRGAVLFAHFGLTGPAILDVSRVVSEYPRGRRPLLVCDFLPDVDEDDFDVRLKATVGENGRRQLRHLLAQWLPQRLADALLDFAQVPVDRLASEFARNERARVVRAVKGAEIAVTGTLGFEKAEVTAGGISLKEIDSRTMQVKQVPGLFATGELLDLDGPIGGFNFQAAFSTGNLAGESV